MSNSSFPLTGRNHVRRLSKRGSYDKETIYGILDEGFLCHISFVMDEQPFMIPTLYGRDGDAIYIHGSHVSRMLGRLETGQRLCLAVTLMDGMVLARSAFHHSMNYRSVVAFGIGRLVTDEAEKMWGLKVVSDSFLKGRWEDTREPNPKEMNVTSVIKIEIEEASAKIRTGMPGDDKEDYELPYWAGVVPMFQGYGTPLPDDFVPQELPLPAYLKDLK